MKYANPVRNGPLPDMYIGMEFILNLCAVNAGKKGMRNRITSEIAIIHLGGFIRHRPDKGGNDG